MNTRTILNTAAALAVHTLLLLFASGTRAQTDQMTFAATADNAIAFERITHITATVTAVDRAMNVNEKFLVGGEEFDIVDENKGETFDVLEHVGAGSKFPLRGVQARYRHALSEVQANNGYRNTGLQLGLITFL